MSDDLLPYFLEEAREQIERASQALTDMERSVDPVSAIEQAFRSIHTLKGSAALFDMAELGALLHAAETELETVRRRGGVLPSREAAILKECVSEIERWIEALEAQGSAPAVRRNAARRLEERLRSAAAPSHASPEIAAKRDWAQDLVRESGVSAVSAVRYTPDAEAYFRGEDPLATIRSIPDLLWLDLECQPTESNTPFACELALSALSGSSPDLVASALRLVADQIEIVAVEAVAPSPIAATVVSRTVRVEAAALDAASELLDQVVVAKNTLAHEIAAELGERAQSARGVVGAQLALERAVAVLHGAVGRLRLAPLRRLFAPLPRQVREMARALGKQAELEMSGEDVAVDKAIMDGLYEPLIHILRNAVDHGLESPEDRSAAGKPEAGVIRLTATPRGDAVVIEAADDGGGLDLPGIRAVALRRGLISEDTAKTMSARESADLIFRPGFSTARTVTDMSGRGVGLDAVRAALTRLGGRVELENHPGRGVVVRMTAPLRTVLTRVGVLCVGSERFGASIDSIREILRIPRVSVQTVGAVEAMVVREEVIPLVHLGELVGGERSRADPLTVVVVESGEGRLGFAVDRIATVLQAQVQTAPPLLSGLSGVSGSILQGDGTVLLLLDLAALAS